VIPVLICISALTLVIIFITGLISYYDILFSGPNHVL
jgi:hypothetical protein